MFSSSGGWRETVEELRMCHSWEWIENSFNMEAERRWAALRHLMCLCQYDGWLMDAVCILSLRDRPFPLVSDSAPNAHIILKWCFYQKTVRIAILIKWKSIPAHATYSSLDITLKLNYNCTLNILYFLPWPLSRCLICKIILEGNGNFLKMLPVDKIKNIIMKLMLSPVEIKSLIIK